MTNTKNELFSILFINNTGGHVTARTNPTIRRTWKLDGNCRTITRKKLEIVSFAMV